MSHVKQCTLPDLDPPPLAATAACLSWRLSWKRDTFSRREQNAGETLPDAKDYRVDFHIASR